jgi:transmembrane secretion effector
MVSAQAAATGAWQAACCVALAFAEPLWSTYALVIALQTGQVIAGPAWQAALPAIAEADELPRAVSVSQATARHPAVAAPAAAGVMVATLGCAPPLLADAATFVLP